jgi:hypothetical protein
MQKVPLFKTGDLIERMCGTNSLSVKIGGQYVVSECQEGFVMLKGNTLGYDPTYFQLVSKVKVEADTIITLEITAADLLLATALLGRSRSKAINPILTAGREMLAGLKKNIRAVMPVTDADRMQLVEYEDDLLEHVFETKAKAAEKDAAKKAADRAADLALLQESLEKATAAILAFHANK